MVKFIPIDPADLPTDRLGRRGRVSYPIVKAFMESNNKMSKMDLTGMSQKPEYLRSVLYSYIRNHNLPVKIFSSQGDLYMMRLDLNNDGTPIEEYKPEEIATEGAVGIDRNVAPVPINADEVAKRFAEEANRTTK